MSVRPQPFTFDTGDLQIAGDRWAGDGDDQPTTILLHGGGQTRHSWKRTAQRLAGAGHPVVALDARGHGDSDWHPQHEYSLDGFVADLTRFAATLDRPPVLVGASLGGITSLAAIGEQPDLACGLVLVDVVVEVERAGVDRIRTFMTAHAEGFASLEEVADVIAAYNPLRPRPRNLDGLRKNVRQHADGRWYWHWDPAFMRIGDEPQRHVDPDRLRAAASRVTVPTLVVRGMQSDVVSDEGMADVLRRIPTARAADVAAAGHMVAGDDNDVFASELEAFLRELA